MSRLDLPEGQWADLRERLLYPQARSIRAGILAASTDEGAVDFDLIAVRAYVSAWYVLDLAGESVPLEAPERAPDDVIQAIAKAAMQKWNGTPDPKGTPGPSAS